MINNIVQFKKKSTDIEDVLVSIEVCVLEDYSVWSRYMPLGKKDWSKWEKIK